MSSTPNSNFLLQRPRCFGIKICASVFFDSPKRGCSHSPSLFPCRNRDKVRSSSSSLVKTSSCWSSSSSMVPSPLSPVAREYLELGIDARELVVLLTVDDD